MKIKEMQNHYNYETILRNILVFSQDMIDDIKLINKYKNFNFKLSIKQIIKIKNTYIELEETLNIFCVDCLNEFLNDCEEFLKSNNSKNDKENKLYLKVKEKINILSDLK